MMNKKVVQHKAGLRENGVSALLCDIRSLWNVGSIFRTADGAGIQKLYLCGETGYPPSSDIAKTALGAEESVAWEYWIDPLECAAALRSKGVRLVALEKTPSSTDFRGYKIHGPVCLVVGNEVGGIPPKILKLCEATLSIPMRGQKESLNVSVAFGVAAYELTRSP